MQITGKFCSWRKMQSHNTDFEINIENTPPGLIRSRGSPALKLVKVFFCHKANEARQKQRQGETQAKVFPAILSF